ncbi:MAG TPA: SAM-dependent chlorinase/fluorinase [Candidatus Eisenbacteria bacterium]
MTRSGIVTLTTDFTTRGGYVGAMRGVILAHDRSLTIADITHDIEPFNILEGALTLRAAARHFPTGTIHLAVVDPGVGGTRRAIIVEGSDGHFFVGPDNGLFTPFFEGGRVSRIDPERAALANLSATFHGRDLFAPVAARLAKGTDPADFGPAIDDPVRLDWPEPATEFDGWRGIVLTIDRFGNAITNLPQSLASPGRTLMTSGREAIPIVRTYAEASRGTVVALVGSSGLIEVAVVEGSAGEVLELAVGSPVHLTKA